MTKALTNIATIALLTLALGAAGCSSTGGTRTVTTVETVECTPPDDEGERDCKTVKRETRVETEDDRDHGCGGIVSCGASAAGQVIALPFRIVGLVLDTVF